MSLPEGEPTGTDIFKVFATKDVANFRWLTLDSLDKPFMTKAAKGVNRSGGLNPLGQMLAYFAEDNPNVESNATRTGNPVAFPSNDWTTRQITINVQQNP